MPPPLDSVEARITEMINAHLADLSNPHKMDIAQIGAASAGDVAAISALLSTHTSDLNNPHQTSVAGEVIRMSDWGLSLNDDNADVINAKLKELPGDITYSIIVDEVYPIGKGILINGHQNMTLTGYGGFRSLGDIYMMTPRNSDRLRFRSIIFDGAELAIMAVDLDECSNASFDGVRFVNIGGGELGNVTGLSVQPECPNLRVSNCWFNNIYSTATGSAKGVSIGNSRDQTKASYYPIIENNLITNIGPVKDADGIKILQAGHDTHAVIRDNIIVNVEKRGVKTQTNYVTTSNNLIINAQYTSIGFQIGKELHSFNDKIHTDGTFVPYYGITLWSHAEQAEYSHSVIGTVIVNNLTNPATSWPTGIMIHGGDGIIPKGSILLDRVRMSGVNRPIGIHAEEIDLLEIDRCQFTNCFGRATVQSGGYQSAGKHYYPTLHNLRFTNNWIENAEGCPYDGYIHRYIAEDYQGDNDNDKVRIVTGNMCKVPIIQMVPGRGNLILRGNAGTPFNIVNGILNSVSDVNPMESSEGHFKMTQVGDVCQNTNTIIIEENEFIHYIVKQWICVGPSSEQKPNGVWIEDRVNLPVASA